MIRRITKITKKTKIMAVIGVMLLIPVVGTTTTAYGTITIATFDEIDRDDPDYQQLISEVIRY